MLIYLCCLVLLGFPIMVMEFSVGRSAGCGIAKAFDRLEPLGTKWHWYKWFGIAGNYLLMMFYTTIGGWMLSYVFKTASGEFVGKTPEQIGNIFNGMLADPLPMTGWILDVLQPSLIVHISAMEELPPLVAEIPAAAKKLAEAFWPGPLTIIMKKSAIVPKETTGGLDTVAVRMPSHPAARAIIRAAGVPLAAPSANLSGLPSPSAFEHVCDDLMGRVEAIVDGGDCAVGLESTVIALRPEGSRQRPCHTPLVNGCTGLTARTH